GGWPKSYPAGRKPTIPGASGTGERLEAVLKTWGAPHLAARSRDASGVEVPRQPCRRSAGVWHAACVIRVPKSAFPGEREDVRDTALANGRYLGRETRCLMRSFKSLSEKEVLALAIALEEEDAR